MSREEFLNKTLYKTELVFLKLLLPIMAFSYLLNSLACYFSVGVQLVTHYLGLVVAPMIFLLISSKVFSLFLI